MHIYLWDGASRTHGQVDDMQADYDLNIDAFFERSLRRVHDARVNVANLGQPKQIRSVLRVTELVRGRLIDRYGSGTRCRVRLTTDVNLLRFESPVVAHELRP